MRKWYQRLYWREVAPRLLKKGNHGVAGAKLFFILGGGRNGSTLLSTILNNHPQLHVPAENYSLIKNAIKWQKLKGKPWSQRVDLMLRNFELDYRSWSVPVSHVKSELDIYSTESFADFISKIYFLNASYCSKSNVKLFGEKTPLYTHHIKGIYSQFPKSKFLILIRNPLDAIASYKRMFPGRSDMLQHCVWRWKDSIRTLKYLNSVDNNEVLLLKYEDLVRNPEAEVQRVQRFLEVEVIEGICELPRSSEAMRVDNNKNHSRIKEIITPESIGSWRTVLNPHEVKMVKSRLGELATHMGYKLD